MSLYKKTFSFPPKSCTHCLFSGWSFPKFSFQVKKKTLIERWIGFAADFWLRLLIWMLLKDHFARMWRGFSWRLTRFVMLENSVNSFAHASCRLHVFHAWIERSIKSTFNDFLFVCCWDYFVCIYLKKLFFSISVNIGRIFTSLSKYSATIQQRIIVKYSWNLTLTASTLIGLSRLHDIEQQICFTSKVRCQCWPSQICFHIWPSSNNCQAI